MLKPTSVLTPKDKAHYIYVIVCEDFCKIGFSYDVDNRVNGLNGACPPVYKLFLHSKFLVPKDSAIRLERWCHFYLKEFWSGKGEWFRITPLRAVQIVQKALKLDQGGNPEWYVKLQHGQNQANKLWADPAHGVKVRAVLAGNREKARQAVLRMWQDPKQRARMSRPNHLRKSV